MAREGAVVVQDILDAISLIEEAAVVEKRKTHVGTQCALHFRPAPISSNNRNI